MICSVCNSNHSLWINCKGGLKGFTNGWGESNCFLNSALQILYNLPIIREELKQRKFAINSFCSQLQQVFNSYSSSSHFSIDTSEVRSTLASIYSASGQFNKHYPGDSMEATLEILNLIHNESLGSAINFSSTQTCYPKCPSHMAFSLLVIEENSCDCGKSRKKDWDYSTFAHQFYVSSLFDQIGQPEKLKSYVHFDFSEQFECSSVMICENRLAYFMKAQRQTVMDYCVGEADDCMFKCTRTEFKLQDPLPEYYIVHLIWEDLRPSLFNLLQVFSSIQYSLTIDQIYSTSSTQIYNLQSMILFGSCHYISLIRKSRNWFKVDDESVLLLGNWEKVIDYSLRSRFYPVGLFYVQGLELVAHDISPEMWITIEVNVLRSSEMRDVKLHKEVWDCECGSVNLKEFDMCEMCSKLKPGVSGWACQNCTMVNSEALTRCEGCGRGRVVQKVERKADSFNAQMKRQSGSVDSKERDINRRGLENQRDIMDVQKAENVDKQNSCRVCDRAIDGRYYRCVECMMLNSGERCQICNSQALKFYCMPCLQNFIRCNTCSQYNHFLSPPCSCRH